MRRIMPYRRELTKAALTGLTIILTFWWCPGLRAAQLIFFVDAVRENRIDDVRELLRDGADVNAKDMFGGNTGLHWAARLGLTEMARLLIDNEANTNARNDDNDTPLHWAAREGQKELVVILIAHGAKINAVGKAGWTPLRWAEAQGHDDIARILVAAGARR
jgi:ankyrin repeat protein